MAFFAYQSYSATGDTTLFPVDFPYISKHHVHAYVNGAEVGFRFLSAGQITLNAIPPVGAAVVIKRISSPDTLLVQFQIDSLNPKDLNLGNTQLIYLIQEILDADAVEFALLQSQLSALQGYLAALLPYTPIVLPLPDFELYIGLLGTTLPPTAGTAWLNGGTLTRTDGAPDIAGMIANGVPGPVIQFSVFLSTLQGTLPTSSGTPWSDGGVISVTDGAVAPTPVDPASALIALIESLPTTAPVTHGVLWNNGGTPTLS